MTEKDDSSPRQSQTLEEAFRVTPGKFVVLVPLPNGLYAHVYGDSPDHIQENADVLHRCLVDDVLRTARFYKKKYGG